MVLAHPLNQSRARRNKYGTDVLCPHEEGYAEQHGQDTYTMPQPPSDAGGQKNRRHYVPKSRAARVRNAAAQRPQTARVQRTGPEVTAAPRPLSAKVGMNELV